MNKIKVLAFIPYYLPGFKSGGPVRTLSNMIEYLGDEYEFYVVTLDHDLHESSEYEGILRGEWNEVGKAKVRYLSLKEIGFVQIKKLLNQIDYDVVFLNSFFDKKFTLPVLFLRWLHLGKGPVVISPRGEFSSGALANKHLLKKIYLFGMNFLGMLKGLVWHASAQPEFADINKIISPSKEHVVLAQDFPTPLNTDFHENNIIRSSEGDVLRIVFLSRIAPMKNLLFAIDVLKDFDKPYIFDIYGMIDDLQYWKKCLKVISNNSLQDKMVYKGEVEHDRVFEVLSGYDLFFLPSLGEGYGHAIIESMTAGTPVLISDKTPWINLEKENVGWDFSLEKKEEFMMALGAMTELSCEERIAFRNKVKQFASRQCESGVKEDNKLVFNTAVNIGSR